MNFGVIISATYRIADLTNSGDVVNADFVFEPSANGSFFEELVAFQDTMPAELSFISVFHYNETVSAVGACEPHNVHSQLLMMP